jgi:hypothetical protein
VAKKNSLLKIGLILAAVVGVIAIAKKVSASTKPFNPWSYWNPQTGFVEMSGALKAINQWKYPTENGALTEAQANQVSTIWKSNINRYDIKRDGGEPSAMDLTMIAIIFRDYGTVVNYNNDIMMQADLNDDGIISEADSQALANWIVGIR